MPVIGTDSLESNGIYWISVSGKESDGNEFVWLGDATGSYTGGNNIYKAPLNEAKLYEYNNPTCDSWRGVYGDDYMAGNQFTIGTVGDNEAFTIDSIEIVGDRSGNPGTTYLYIYAIDVNGFPTGAVLADGSFNGNILGTTLHQDTIMVDISDDGYIVTASTTYTWHIKAPSGDEDNMIRLSRETDDTYAGGYAIYSDAGGWSKDTGDDWDHYWKIYGHYGSGEMIWLTNSDYDMSFEICGSEVIRTATYRGISISNASHKGMPTTKVIKYRNIIYE